MKPALALLLTVLLLPACGGSASSPTSKSDTNPASAPPATDAPKPGDASQPAATTQPATTTAEPAKPSVPTAAGTPEGETINQILKGLDDLPTQDELDAAAAARIDEATADAEYEKLKAEIEGDLANPPEDG